MHTRYLWKIFWFWNIKNNLDNYKTHVNYDKSQIQCYLVIKNHYYLEYIVSWKHLWCNNKWKKGKIKNIQLGNKIKELEIIKHKITSLENKIGASLDKGINENKDIIILLIILTLTFKVHCNEWNLFGLGIKSL